jgi:uroporphyrinogen-III synthase
VDVVEAYRTVVPEQAAEDIRRIFGGPRKPDMVTFTSSSTVQNFVAAAGGGAVGGGGVTACGGAALLGGVKAVSIGPVTTRTARELGIEIAAEAHPFTVDGLLEAVLGLCQ